MLHLHKYFLTLSLEMISQSSSFAGHITCGVAVWNIPVIQETHILWPHSVCHGSFNTSRQTTHLKRAGSDAKLGRGPSRTVRIRLGGGAAIHHFTVPKCVNVGRVDLSRPVAKRAHFGTVKWCILSRQTHHLQA